LVSFAIHLGTPATVTMIEGKMEQTSAHANNRCLVRLGAAIRKRRKAFGLTQAEFAALAGVSTNLLSQVEHGKPTAHVGKLLDILHAAGLQFDLVNGRERISMDNLVQ